MRSPWLTTFIYVDDDYLDAFIRRWVDEDVFTWLWEVQVYCRSDSAYSGKPCIHAAKLNTEGAKLIERGESKLKKGRKQFREGESFESDISFKGNVTAYKSNGLSEQTSEPFNVFSYKGFQLGELKIGGTNNDAAEQDANLKLVQSLKKLENADTKAIDADTVAAMQNGMEGAMMEILSGAMGSMFSGFSNSADKDTISIPVFTTPGLERIELYDGSRKLKAEGLMGSDGVKYYNFEKPSQPMVTVKVFYWSNLEAVKLGFEL